MKRRNQASSLPLLLWAAVAALLSQNMVIPVMSAANFEDQKNYYSPDPNARTPPVSHTPPSHGSGGGHATPTPSHGGGSYGGTPPANCGNPPSGGHHHTTPSPPTGGGGGYYHSPPTSTPTTPTTPTPVVLTPPTIVTPPTVVTPPSTPIDPGTPTTPGITIPSPPFSFNPNSPPFTCTYWRNHPTLIWGLFGIWGTTVGNAFGLSSVPGFGSNMNILQALSNTRTDGLGELYREGTAALLNSMAHTRFPYTTSQVRDSFVSALSSNKAAASQAQLFKQANEGRTKPRA
ncbi:hypothetical protein BUALT_Bualt03G0180300 [Buddleja alternifolia]|uniref:Protodermal factor 1 n=1 Tax=Buddleja alternifolia TaxID=168488 RepID=A0AAV6Y5K1_9LAMI|nr:hypothetical protein BUALT_Bualt03G0180300 [Buddleja alternifolia]